MKSPHRLCLIMSKFMLQTVRVQTEPNRSVVWRKVSIQWWRSNSVRRTHSIHSGQNIFYFFTIAPKITVTDIERVIVSRVPLTITGKHAEMPYGPSMYPCDNSSTVATDGTGCVDNGVVANKTYIFTSSFKVLKSFPSVSSTTNTLLFCKSTLINFF